jgi:ryanodine receptor 2
VIEDESAEDDLEALAAAVGSGGKEDSGGSDESGGEEEGEDEEYVHVNEKFYYLEYIIRTLGIIHAIISFCMLIAYYNLKVPLALFKREKEVARRLEFDGLYLAEQPEDDDIKAHWDKLVISARSFPARYWDKFVKKRVRQKFSVQFEFDDISNTLGMEKSALRQDEGDKKGIVQLVMSIDWRYQVWKSGVTITDKVRNKIELERAFGFSYFSLSALPVPVVVLYLLHPW